jgi:hypothetical protein
MHGSHLPFVPVQGIGSSIPGIDAFIGAISSAALVSNVGALTF